MTSADLLACFEEDFKAKVAEIRRDIKEEYFSSGNYPWIIGFSGGKDSTLVAQAVLEAILSIKPTARFRDVHVVSNDTFVESPMVTVQVCKMILDRLLETEKEFGDRLISKEEIDFIESTWADELLQKVSPQHLQQAVAHA